MPASTLSTLASPLKKTQLGRKLSSIFSKKVSSHFKQDQPLLSQLLRNVHGKVLLIGSNLSLVLQHLRFPTVSHVVAIEPEPSRHNELREMAKHSKIPIAILGSRVETMDFKDASFDSIVVTYALSAASNPDEYLRKVYRWLAPNGTFHILEHLEPHGREQQQRNPLLDSATKATTPCSPKVDILRKLEALSWDKGSEFAIFYRRHHIKEDPVQHLMGTAKKPAY